MWCHQTRPQSARAEGLMLLGQRKWIPLTISVISKCRAPKLPWHYRFVLARGQVFSYFDNKIPIEFNHRAVLLLPCGSRSNVGTEGSGCSQSTTFSFRFPQEASFCLSCTTRIFSTFFPLHRLTLIHVS